MSTSNQQSNAKWWYAAVALAAIGLFYFFLKKAVPPLPDPASIPTFKLPSPNAFDTFSDAEKLLRDGDAVSWAMGKAIPGTPPAGESASDPTSGYHVFTDGEKANLVSENQPAIEKLREGFSQAYMCPQARTFTATFPYYSKDRQFARMLSLQTQVLEHQGNWGAAMTSSLDSIQLGSQIPHGSPLIGKLVAIACDEIGQRRIFQDKIADHLNSYDAKADAQRLARIDLREVAFADVLQTDQWYAQASLLDLFQKPDWRSTLGAMSGSSIPASVAPIANVFSSLLMTPGGTYRSYTTYSSREISIAKLPWPEMRKAPEPNVPSVLSGILVVPLSKMILKPYAASTLNRILEVQLALRAYQLDHHTYPASLTQLVPECIPSVPLDPFTDSQPLKYKTTSTGYLLYSVGPDGIDNGGKPIDNSSFMPGLKGNQIHSPFYDIDAKGDIVAGVNY